MKIMFAGASGVGKTTLAKEVPGMIKFDVSEYPPVLDFISGSVSDLIPKTKDMSHKEMNHSIIRHNIEIKFEQVILKYNDDLHDIDFHIESRSQAGLIDVVKQLKTKRETLQRHVDKLHEMEADFRNEVPYMMGVLLSYERGFLRGLAALSLDTLKNK